MSNFDPTATGSDLLSDRLRIEEIVEETLIDIFKILDESKALIMEVTAAFRNYCGTPEKSFCLLGHGYKKVTSKQNVVLGNFSRIPFFFVSLLLEATLVEEIAGSKNNMRSHATKILPFECIPVLDREKIT